MLGRGGQGGGGGMYQNEPADEESEQSESESSEDGHATLTGWATAMHVHITYVLVIASVVPIIGLVIGYIDLVF